MQTFNGRFEVGDRGIRGFRRVRSSVLNLWAQCGAVVLKRHRRMRRRVSQMASGRRVAAVQRARRTAHHVAHSVRASLLRVAIKSSVSVWNLQRILIPIESGLEHYSRAAPIRRIASRRPERHLRPVEHQKLLLDAPARLQCASNAGRQEDSRPLDRHQFHAAVRTKVLSPSAGVAIAVNCSVVPQAVLRQSVIRALVPVLSAAAVMVAVLSPVGARRSARSGAREERDDRKEHGKSDAGARSDRSYTRRVQRNRRNTCSFTIQYVAFM